MGTPALDREGQPWSAKEDAMLGTDSDRNVAAKLGRSTGAVVYRRKKLGIPPHRKPRKASGTQ